MSSTISCFGHTSPGTDFKAKQSTSSLLTLTAESSSESSSLGSFCNGRNRHLMKFTFEFGKEMIVLEET